MAKKVPIPENVADLVAAMQHVCLAQQETGEIYQAHCQIHNNTIVSFNGIISAGVVIREQISACPHSLKLLAALMRARETVAIASENDRLTMISGPLRIVIQCVSPNSLPPIAPDPPLAAVDNDALRASLKIVGGFASEGAETMLGASVISNNGSLAFVDGKLLIEHWHGQSMPECLIPKLFIQSVDKIKLRIQQIGFSGRTITFWFDNLAWLKTQLYDETIPKWKQILESPFLKEPLLPGMFEAIATVAPFSPDHFVHLRPDYVYSHSEPSLGARHELPFSTVTATLNAKQCAMIAPYAKEIDWRNERAVLFFGDNLRGAMAKIVPR